MTNCSTKSAKSAQFSDEKSEGKTKKNAENRKSDELAVALVVSAVKAYRRGEDCRCIPITSKLKTIPSNQEIEFELWKNADVRQVGHIHHMVMHLNVFRDGGTDLVMPFSVWPLRRNHKLYTKSDAELAAYFNKHLNEALEQLQIEPEYFYVITGEPNPSDKRNKRHIHGCIRLPERFCDEHGLEADKVIYDALKRAGGLTDRYRKQIESEGRHRKDALFAIAANNNNKPHGYMVDFRPELSPKDGQLKWAEYITSERNRPNTLRRSVNLESQVGRLNDKLYRAQEALRSDTCWHNHNDRFDKLTDAWSEVITEYVNDTSGGIR
ncbi:hypothetical protein KW542_16020 [Vibrio fluvialis]|nr:hypothetical protein [Vibrio fluvialis]MBY8249860.1 hypothetical protein [Vibrio fluvialis]MBY8283556.1 hypothetical protein [Vibrio fluvialis]